MTKPKALPSTKLPPRDLIYKHLRTGVANFKFIKSNGEEREMNATLIAAKMDPRLVPVTNPTHRRKILTCSRYGTSTLRVGGSSRFLH